MSGSIRKQETVVRKAGTEPPVFWIDLDLPPYQRYVELATAYTDKIASLTGLFDDLVASLYPRVSPEWFRRIARISLTKLHSREETEEIRGISDATNVDFYLVVALNVLLDALMGCTSGVVRSCEKNETEIKMLHFRTLDWGMEELRRVIIQLNFRRSKSAEPQKAIASSITYVGFVGVLTGVREGLSMSLNFRPLHNATTYLGHLRYYSHLLFVLMGWRRSVSSLLRSYLFAASSGSRPASLDTIAEELPQSASTAAYLIFSDGKSALTLEKDHRSACICSSDDFIVLTNHDLDEYKGRQDHRTFYDPIVAERFTIAEAIQESVDRRNTMAKNWQRKSKQIERDTKPQMDQIPASDAQSSSFSRTSSRASQRSSRRTRNSIDSDVHAVRQGSQSVSASSKKDVSVTHAEVIRWLSKWPTTNEQTHFAAILDAKEGKITWVRQYLTAVPEPGEAPSVPRSQLHIE
ncbi:MAG: hypothetical protein Q9227_004705 [Pyrenula ochraceoflavens]